MPLRDALVPEFDHEMAGVRTTLERVPDEKFNWKPHEKSFTLGRLATHLAEIPGWIGVTMTSDSMDLAPIDGPAYTPPEISSRAQLLAMFDKNVASGRAVLAETSDETMFQNWSLLKAGKTMLSMPKIAVLRGFILSHAIHHRAQLGLYLRMNDIPVPSIYGPSADEGQF